MNTEAHQIWSVTVIICVICITFGILMNNDLTAKNEADSLSHAYDKALLDPPIDGWTPDDNVQDPYLPDPSDYEVEGPEARPYEVVFWEQRRIVISVEAADDVEALDLADDVYMNLGEEDLPAGVEIDSQEIKARYV